MCPYEAPYVSSEDPVFTEQCHADIVLVGFPDVLSEEGQLLWNCHSCNTERKHRSSRVLTASLAGVPCDLDSTDFVLFRGSCAFHPLVVLKQGSVRTGGQGRGASPPLGELRACTLPRLVRPEFFIPRPCGLVYDSVWLQVKLRFERAGRRGLGWPKFVDSVLLRNPLAARRFHGVSSIPIRHRV